MNPYIRLPRVSILKGRQSLILAQCEAKRVLHLGCVDAGLLHERFKSDALLHQKLVAIAEEVWGVDIDAEGITFLQDQGFDHLLVGDVCELDRITPLQGKTFDVIVASEVVEHLQNPGFFLNSVKALMTPGKTDLIVTVPNAFRLDTLIWLMRGVEYVHPDHNYWFSYYTLTNLLRKNGFRIEQTYVYSFQSGSVLPGPIRRLLQRGDVDSTEHKALFSDSSRGSFIQRLVGYLKSLPKRVLVSFCYNRTPFWADGIIAIARLADDDG